MKKITFCIIALFCCINVFAQQGHDYTPLVREGVEWGYYNYVGFTDGNHYVDPYRIQFKGDATIEGKTYKKVYAYSSCTLNEAEADLVGWIREQNKQVFFIINTGYNISKHINHFDTEIKPNVEYIIYDFTPEEVGGKVTLWGNETTVKHISYIEVNGNQHKQIEFQESLWYFPIVDGLGFVNDGGGNVVFPAQPVAANGSQYSCLNYVKAVGGNYLYTRPDFNQNFVDPCVASVTNLNSDNLKLLQNDDAITIMPARNGVSTIQLVDVAGAVVYNEISDTNDSVTIPTTGFAPGVYIVILASETDKSTCKIIIK